MATQSSVLAWRIPGTGEANIRFISIEAREKAQQNESGNRDNGRQKMESPHVDTCLKREEGALKM